MLEEERSLRIDEQALDWLLRTKNGLDARSESALRAWLEIDPNHQAAYARWCADWRSFDQLDADQLGRLRLQASGSQDALMQSSWLRRARDACADFWSEAPARCVAVGGALGLLLGVSLLGALGRYLG